MMLIPYDDYLEHFGTLRKSGRYPWGSGADEPENARNKNFLEYVAEFRKKGMTETEIAAQLEITRNELTALKARAREEQKASRVAEVVRLKERDGYSNMAIAAKMGINESSVRALYADREKDSLQQLKSIADMLQRQVGPERYLDIGKGVENHIGVTKDRLANAVSILKDEGYVVHNIQEDQLGTTNKTIVKVLAPPGVTYRDIVMNKDRIRLINESSDDNGRSFLGLHPPLQISQKRVDIRYGEDGGAAADGTIYVRPGVKDLSLGGKSYAQVRIAVDGTHYIKGMAIYKDDLPSGIDLQVNTPKHNTGNKLDALKKIEDDPDNPFGSVVRQIVSIDKHGKERVTSAINLVNDEGQWDKWNRTLSSQMLSKQRPALAKTQLDLTFQQKQEHFAQIKGLTNPTVRRKLLEEFADSTDASSVHLKAAALPRQRTQVILPIKSLKDNEVYAPNFLPGERVVLIRFPHGGTFEIPELVVNNSNREATSLLGQARDAIGINHKVAERLSGADFDGDTVLVIPNNHGLVSTSPALAGLKNFDPKASYPKYEGMPVMKSKTKGLEMGLISNLITDMTIRGASDQEKARALRHSMVVIDAQKHELNYKQSAIDNNIRQLKKKYQTSTGGASTLISRKKQDMDVPERKATSRIDPTTGKKIFIETGRPSYVNKRGETITPTSKVKRLAETDDAHTMSSGTPIEKLYADHSNRLKRLADDARLAAVNTPSLIKSTSAKKIYAPQIQTLDASLNRALKNAPLERRAQLFANATIRAKREANPDIEPSELKKLKFQALAEARRRFDANKERIKISDIEWEAIQAGAISHSKLSEILNNADMDRVKELASPRQPLLMTSVRTTRAKAMLARGYTQADVAAALGVSLTTLMTTMDGE